MKLSEYHIKVKKFMKDDSSMKVHASYGLITEVGELVDIFKKSEFYGLPLDLASAEEEIGDILFYLVFMCDILGIKIDNAARKNIEKLSKRYPNGFSQTAALERADKK